MTNPGESTLQLVDEVLNDGVEHLVLLIRHSAREFEPGRHDLLNPLTDEGRDLAQALGERLPKQFTVRGYSSPAERCIETADLVMAGHEKGGGEVTRNRVVEALGVFYVLDQMKMFMSMQAAGSMTDFLNSWFNGEVHDDILMPADITARIVGRLAKTKLSQKGDAPQLDLLVSHDFTLYTLKDRLLGQDTARFPDVHFLDGIAFFEKDGRTYVRSHHEEAIELETNLGELG